MRPDEDQTHISYEDLVRDPELVEVLHRRGRQMRAVEGGRAVSALMRRLFGRDVPKPQAPAAPCDAISNGVRIAVTC